MEEEEDIIPVGVYPNDSIYILNIIKVPRVSIIDRSGTGLGTVGSAQTYD